MLYGFRNLAGDDDWNCFETKENDSNPLLYIKSDVSDCYDYSIEWLSFWDCDSRIQYSADYNWRLLGFDLLRIVSEKNDSIEY